jgi:hypothetical protein
MEPIFPAVMRVAPLRIASEGIVYIKLDCVSWHADVRAVTIEHDVVPFTAIVNECS